MYLVQIETTGNQPYIFATNRLRENVGASELTWQVGTTFVLDAISELGGPRGLCDERREETRKALVDEARNPRIETGGRIEVVVATSGKAILLVREGDVARELVSRVTARALDEAPGLTVFGMVRAFDFDRDDFGRTSQELQLEAESERWRYESTALRYPQVPIAARCRTSGLPAQGTVSDQGDERACSASAYAKHCAASAFIERMRLLVRQDRHKRAVPRNVGDLEKMNDSSNWLAVVHADGNGLGDVFLHFADRAGVTGKSRRERNRDHIDKLRLFSLGLEACTEAAFLDALRVFPEKKTRKPVYPVLPLVLGGDDLTVMCDGLYALVFAAAYLDAFERHTRHAGGKYTGIMNQVARATCKGDREGTYPLAASAGVAIIKAHYPFHAAYDLAEALTASAKKAKERVTRNGVPWPCSSLDFHVLFDNAHADLDGIRARATIDRGAGVPASKEPIIRLYAKPYVVSPAEHLEACDTGDWWSIRVWESLVSRVSALLEKGDGGRRKLPSSQMHFLREALYPDPGKADGRLQFVLDHCKDLEFDAYPKSRKGEGPSGFALLLPNPSVASLFVEDVSEDSRPVMVTPFPDALEAMEFLGGV